MVVKKRRTVKKSKKSPDNIIEEATKPLLPNKPTAPAVLANGAFNEITQQEYDLYDELEADDHYVHTKDAKNTLTIFIDGVDQLRRDDRSLSKNHLVKRNPYYFLWVAKSDMVGDLAKGILVVKRTWWNIFKEKFNASLLADHSPGEDYIQNQDMILVRMKYENWRQLSQKANFISEYNRLKASNERQERSRQIADVVERTGDMRYAHEAYEADRLESVRQKAEVAQVKGNLNESLDEIMRRLEKGSLSDEEMSRALELTSTAKDKIDIII